MWLPLIVCCYYIGEAVSCLEPWWRSSSWTLLSFYLSGLLYWRLFNISLLTWCISLYLECICYFVVLFFSIFKEHQAQLLSTRYYIEQPVICTFISAISLIFLSVCRVYQKVLDIRKVLFSHLALDHTVFKFEHLK